MITKRFSTALSAAMFLTSAGSFSVAEEERTRFDNPIVKQRADPWVWRHDDGRYYFIATVPEYDRIELRRADSIQQLGDTEPKVIWRKHSTGEMGAHIWAPELHHIDGKWYIYFAAGAAEDVWAIRMYVLECASDDPLEGEWTEKGRLQTNWSSFSLDATTFEHEGERFLVWAQKGRRSRDNSNLYIAKMDTPWSISGAQVILSRPEFDWERKLFAVNEGPAVIKKNGRIFVTYSASGTDHNYCMGLLSADRDDDLLGADSWTKASAPVFTTSEVNGIYGPGHNSFTKTPAGEDVLIYHARSYKEIDGDPLHDPNRHTRAQVFQWNDDGTPHFSEPAGPGSE